jgi:dsRNA-specific ribonuclease
MFSGSDDMKALHSGASEFTHVRTEQDTVAYSWTFEEAQDHEHPYILTVTVAGHAHSEGYTRDIGPGEASKAAERVARDLYQASS